MMATDFARHLRVLLLQEMFGKEFRLDQLPSSLGGKIGQLIERKQGEEDAREQVAYIRGVKRAIDIIDELIREEL